MKAGLVLALSIIGSLIAQVRAQEKAPDGMVLIERGSFIMGSNDSPGALSYPGHPVTLDAFYMDSCEVTNAQYAIFCEATGRRYPEFWGLERFKSGAAYPDYPVIGVNYADAAAYAEWAGKRIPTEAEWEYAARGGLEGLSYPYGEKASHDFARYKDPEAERGPVPVGSYPPNDYGLYDMSGNVWEWVSDWFEADYYTHSPENNPQGPDRGNFRVLRGGGWHSGPGCTSVTNRNALPQYWVDIAGGFRCVKDVE